MLTVMFWLGCGKRSYVKWLWIKCWGNNGNDVRVEWRRLPAERGSLTHFLDSCTNKEQFDFFFRIEMKDRTAGPNNWWKSGIVVFPEKLDQWKWIATKDELQLSRGRVKILTVHMENISRQISRQLLDPIIVHLASVGLIYVVYPS